MAAIVRARVFSNHLHFYLAQRCRRFCLTIKERTYRERMTVLDGRGRSSKPPNVCTPFRRVVRVWAPACWQSGALKVEVITLRPRTALFSCETTLGKHLGDSFKFSYQISLRRAWKLVHRKRRGPTRERPRCSYFGFHTCTSNTLQSFRCIPPYSFWTLLI